jgi:acyl transferase domain-containing protein
VELAHEGGCVAAAVALGAASLEEAHEVLVAEGDLVREHLTGAAALGTLAHGAAQEEARQPIREIAAEHQEVAVPQLVEQVDLGSSKNLDFQSPWHHFQLVRLFG